MISGQPHVRVIYPTDRPVERPGPPLARAPGPGGAAVAGRAAPVARGARSAARRSWAEVVGRPHVLVLGGAGRASTKGAAGPRSAHLTVTTPSPRPAAAVRREEPRPQEPPTGAAGLRADGPLQKGRLLKRRLPDGPVLDRPLPDGPPARETGLLGDAPLWEALRREGFVLRRCRDCRAWLDPVPQRCRHCAGPTVVEPASGAGVVDSFIVVRHPAVPAFAGRRPYALALVTLDEGVRLPGRLDGVRPAEVTIGQPVRAALDLRPGADTPSVVFHPRVPAGAGAAS
jgi:uncharacterized OB-fold protein